MQIRQATYSDMDSLMKVFDGARQIMRASGNHSQWNDGYPSKEIVTEDIKGGNCFVISENGNIVGTMALIEGPDPTYSHIDGEWPDERPYYVIHRIAASAPGRDSARQMLDWAYAHIII